MFVYVLDFHIVTYLEEEEKLENILILVSWIMIRLEMLVIYTWNQNMEANVIIAVHFISQRYWEHFGNYSFPFNIPQTDATVDS